MRLFRVKVEQDAGQKEGGITLAVKQAVEQLVLHRLQRGNSPDLRTRLRCQSQRG